MAGKCKEMSKIKQVLRLYQGGMSKRAIGRELGLYKGTVNKYVNLAELDPLSLDELLRLDDPILEKRLTGGNPAYSDKRFDDLQGRLPYIAEELSNKNKTHVTRYLLWEEYKQDNPNGYEYTQFCFHVNQSLWLCNASGKSIQAQRQGQCRRLHMSSIQADIRAIEASAVLLSGGLERGH